MQNEISPPITKATDLSAHTPVMAQYPSCLAILGGKLGV